MTQYQISNLRFPDETEADADSPISEVLMQTLLHNFEALVLMLYKHGDNGSLTSDPPNDTTGVLTDTARSFNVDEHNGRSILFTSGTAKNKAFTITDTTATTIIVDGTNLYDEGARSGDTYVITYCLQPNYGHTHNGVDTNTITPASASIAQANLKTSTGEVSKLAGQSGNLTLPGGEYGFFVQFKHSTGSANSDSAQLKGTGFGATSYTTNIYIANNTTGIDYYAQQRYVTSSGEIHWLYTLRDYQTGAIISQYSAPDHPCFGNGGKPLVVAHPFPDVYEKSGALYLPTLDPETGLITDSPQQVEIIVINPDLADVAKVEKARMVEDETKPDLSWLEAFNLIFEVNESATADWPDIPVTVGLPKTNDRGQLIGDPRFADKNTTILPIKKTIVKPPLFNVAAIKPKKPDAQENGDQGKGE